MKPYRHLVQYYETDMMGVARHANYIRWMEEARVDFLSQLGFPYAAMEQAAGKQDEKEKNGGPAREARDGKEGKP